MRLIDADALKYKRKPNTSNTGGNNSLRYCSYEDVQNTPTVDAVPVVRCKDCMFYDNRENIGWCILHSHYTSELKDDWTCFNEDDYCSQGKKMDEVQDEM